MDDAMAEIQVAPSTRPKKPFLKRGEGTARRVYASRYRDEAKKKREEMQRKAMERQEARERKRCENNDDRFVDLRDTQSVTFLPRDTYDDKHVLGEMPSPSLTPAIGEEESAMRPNRFNASSSVDASNPTNDETRVDGSCVVESSENCPDAVDTRDDPNTVIEAKHLRESEWLECQRRYEDEQWVEAMELREFAALEKKIADETRDRLAKAEDTLKKKHVTFEEPHGFGEEDAVFTPQSSKEDAGDVFETGSVNEFRKKRENVEQKTSPMSGQKGFQKLKKMSVARIAKTQHAESPTLSTTSPRRQSLPEQTHGRQRISQAKSERAPSKKVRRYCSRLIFSRGRC